MKQILKSELKNLRKAYMLSFESLIVVHLNYLLNKGSYIDLLKIEINCSVY